MTRSFKGRVVVGGEVTAKALVSRGGFNTLANISTVGSVANRANVCEDQNNPDIYGKVFPGCALCLPETIGSTTGGMVLYCVGKTGLGPKCMLFSKRADTLAISGAVLLANWSNNPMVMIDELGTDFLEYVKEGMTVSTASDGTVTVSD